MEHEVVLDVVERARRRLAARRAWYWGARAALLWSGLMLALALARTVVPLEWRSGLLAFAGFLAAVAASAVLAALWSVPPRLAAQIVDLRFACADRLATAVEVITGICGPSALADVQVKDAARAAAELDLRRGLPARPPRAFWGAAALVVAALVADSALVGVTLPGTPAREVVQTIRREGRRLERAGETLEERARLERARVTRRTAPSLRSLGEMLRRERMERSEALARIEALSRQVEAARRQMQARAAEQTGQPPRSGPTPSDLFRRRAAADRTLRQIREIADRLAQSRSPQERQSLMQQLAALAGGGEEGDVPTRAREQAAAAQRQLAAGDAAGARRTLQQSATDLDDLRAMLADEEGLQQVQRDLKRSASQIARGRPVPEEAEQTPQAVTQPGDVAPGNRPPTEGNTQTAAEPPPGPNQGVTPGQGAVAEKLGERAPRLEADRQQSRIRGLQGEGRVTTSDLLGPGRPAQVRAPQGKALTTARAQADRYIARMRIPPEYREIVRRYFEALAAGR